ncbi:MAG: hypothetical protein ACP5HQ_01880 [Thermoprotei archaeon]
MPTNDSRRIVSDEILLPVSIDYLASFVLDPFTVVGATGHILLMHTIDEKTLAIQQGISSIKPQKDFFSLLLVPQFDDPMQMTIFKGTFEGPDVDVDGDRISVTYRGLWDGGRIYVTLTFVLSKKGNKLTGLVISLEYVSKLSLWTKLSVVPLDKFFWNMVHKYLVPHYQLYIDTLKFSNSQNKTEDMIPLVEPRVLVSIRGKVNEVLTDALRAAKKAQHTILVVKSENLRGYIILNQGWVTRAVFQTKEGTLEGDEAVLRIMTLNSPVEVTVYSVDVTQAFERWATEFATRTAELS